MLFVKAILAIFVKGYYLDPGEITNFPPFVKANFDPFVKEF